MSGCQHWHITQLLMCMNLLMIMIALVRDANQHDWLQDLQNIRNDSKGSELRMMSRLLTRSGTMMEIFLGTPTQLNFNHSVASDLTRHQIINVKVYGQDNVHQL